MTRLTTFPLLVPLDLFGGIGRFFDSLMQPLYTAISAVLVFCHWIASLVLPRDSGWAWVLAILLLTLIVRGALVPLYLRSLQSTRAMQLVQPKMKVLQDKYGGDRQKLGEEQMKLYKEEGVNPMASCLPLLIQTPIIWALFAVLNGAAREQPQGWFLRNRPDLVHSMAHAELLGGKFSKSFFPLQPFGATQVICLVMIVAMSLLMFWQQRVMMAKNTPPSALEGPMGQQQKMMLYLFPIMFAVGGISIPLGVLFYWSFSSIFTYVQQEVFIRTHPTPNTPAYVDWQERMRAKGKDPEAVERELQDKRKRKRVVEATTTGAEGKVQRQTVSVDRKGRQTNASRTSTSAGRVARQTTTKDAPAAGTSTPAASGVEVGGVQRQQPKRQSRAVRRKPTSAASAAPRVTESDED